MLSTKINVLNKLSKFTKVFLVATSVSLAGMVSTSAWSQSSDFNDTRIRERGVSLEFGLGANLWLQHGKNTNVGVIGGLGLGFKFNKNISAEINLTGFDEVFFKGGKIVSFSIKGLLPYESGFQLYAKTGPSVFISGHYDALSDDDNNLILDGGRFAWNLGVGVEYYFTQGFYTGIGLDSVIFKGNRDLNTFGIARLNLGYVF